MCKWRQRARWFFVAVCFLAGCGVYAQGRPGTDSLSISAAPGLVAFALPPNGVASGSSPVSITTTWQFQRGGTQISVYAYFTNSAAALTDGTGSNIPSARVSGSVNGGPAAPFTGTGPYSAGGSLTVFTTLVRNNKKTTRVDDVNLQIDTTGLGLRAGSYSGVMRIQSFAL